VQQGFDELARVRRAKEIKKKAPPPSQRTTPPSTRRGDYLMILSCYVSCFPYFKLFCISKIFVV
jgi:hypothetical protein